jgi:nitrogen regulatory protein PII
MEKDLKQKKASTSRRTSLVKPFKKTDSAKTGAVKTTQKQTKNKVNSNKLELLITIVSRQKAEFYVDLIQSFEVNMQMMVLGEGTANKEILDYLGMTNEKTVIFSLVKAERLKDVLETLSDKFRTIKKGKGIAYTIPLTSVIGTAIYAFLSNNENAVKGDSYGKI